MKLLRSASSTPFCVPAAIALITGVHLDTIENELREYLGDQPIAGIYYPIALALLKRHGFAYQPIKRLAKIGTFLCCTKTHMFVYHDGMYFDNSRPEGQKSHELSRTNLMFRIEKTQ